MPKSKSKPEERPSQELMSRPTRDVKMAKQGCMTIREAAARLKVSDKRVYALATTGELELKRFGGAVYVTTKSVDAYEKVSTVRPGLISIADANVKYGFSRATLFRYIRDGRLRVVRVKKLVYFEKAELDWVLLGKGEPIKGGGGVVKKKKRQQPDDAR